MNKLSAMKSSSKLLLALALPVLSVAAVLSVPTQSVSAAAGPYVHFRNNCKSAHQGSVSWNKRAVGVIVPANSTKSVKVPQSTPLTTYLGGTYAKHHYIPSVYGSVTRNVCG